jgi:hypothetical protein
VRIRELAGGVRAGTFQNSIYPDEPAPLALMFPGIYVESGAALSIKRQPSACRLLKSATEVHGNSNVKRVI